MRECILCESFSSMRDIKEPLTHSLILQTRPGARSAVYHELYLLLKTTEGPINRYKLHCALRKQVMEL